MQTWNSILGAVRFCSSSKRTMRTNPDRTKVAMTPKSAHLLSIVCRLPFFGTVCYDWMPMVFSLLLERKSNAWIGLSIRSHQSAKWEHRRLLVACFRLPVRAKATISKVSESSSCPVWSWRYGHTLTEIAGRLNISRKSIETYRARIREKLGLHTRAEIVRYALETGILNGQAQYAS